MHSYLLFLHDNCLLAHQRTEATSIVFRVSLYIRDDIINVDKLHILFELWEKGNISSRSQRVFFEVASLIFRLLLIEQTDINQESRFNLTGRM